MVVLGFALLVMLIVGIRVIPYRRRLNAPYAAEAERQGLLVEAVHGIQTIKTLALEPLQRRNWEGRLSPPWRCALASSASRRLRSRLSSLPSG